MGILRTDKISGLETPTAVTGSVVFDGNGDRLSVSTSSDLDLTEDLTLELWIYINSTPNNYITFFNTSSNGTYTSETSVFWGKSEKYFALNVSGTTLLTVSTPSDPTNTWYHIAVTRSGSTTRLFLNGQEADSSTTSWSAITGQTWYIGDRPSGAVSANYPLDGYISNLRVLKGTALYTSNFTPPTHELEVIGDTSLLCCNNPDSAGAEGTGKTITVSGDAAASTFSPGLTRDFTYGTEFKGVTTFDTQGYFVPPSGTTEQRGRGRGVIGWANNPVTIGIDYITISSMGNALKFGDLTSSSRWGSHGCASATRGLFAGGYINTPAATFYNIIEYVTISSTGNPVNFGDLTEKTYRSSCLASSTRGVFAHGYKDTPSAFTITNTISYVTIASLGDSANFGDLAVESLANSAALSSSTRGVIVGGVSPAEVNTMQYLTIATTGDTIDFGDLTENQNSPMATSSPTRGIIGGGYDAPTNTKTIGYITIASTGNAQDFGDLTGLYSVGGAVSNSLRGVFVGGYTSPSRHNLMEYVTISSTGNTKDFGDLLYARRDFAAFSDSHGGLS